MTLLIVALSIVAAGFTVQQHPMTDTTSAVHYRVYRADGTPSSLDDIAAALDDVDVLFVGESHNDPIVHYLERKLLERAFAKKASGNGTLALSMEMFTRDVQYILDEYLDDLVTESQFLAASEPWNNYKTDYRPLVEFAREHKLDVIAANAPRRYANRVSRLGRESLKDLSPQALSYLAPLPYGKASEKYAEQFAQAMREAMEESPATPAVAEEKETEETATCGCEGGMMDDMMSMHHEEGEGMQEGAEGMEGMSHEEMMRMHHGESGGEMGENEAGEGEAEQGEEHEMEHAGMEGMEGMSHEEMMRMHHGDEGEGMEEADDEGDGQEKAAAEANPSGEAAAPVHGMGGGMPSIDNMLDSQSLWDATMAYAISEYLKGHPGTQVMHVVGSFHVQTGTGIPEHLARYAPQARMLIVTVEPSEDVTQFDRDEDTDLGDFVILSDESLPRTFDSPQ